QRTLKAEWLHEAAKQGLDIKGAIVSGDLNFRQVTLNNGISLIDCETRGAVDFSHAECKQNLILSGTRFHQRALFTGLNVGQDLVLDGAEFLLDADKSSREKVVRFINLHVQGSFSASFTAKNYQNRTLFADGVDAD